MLTKTKIALVAALVAGSATVASAQGFDPNPANRGYPMFANPGEAMPYLGLMHQRGGAATTVREVPVGLRHHRRGAVETAPAPQGWQSAPVRLYQGAPYGGRQQDEIGVDLNDRASSPYAGGVG